MLIIFVRVSMGYMVQLPLPLPLPWLLEAGSLKQRSQPATTGNALEVTRSRLHASMRGDGGKQTLALYGPTKESSLVTEAHALRATR